MPPPSLPDLAPLAGLLVLLELAVGTVAVSAALDHVGRVGRGFAGTTAAICALIMGTDLLVLSGSSDFGALLHGPVDSGAVAGFAHWAVAFTVLLVVDALFAAVGTEVARRVVAAVTVRRRRAHHRDGRDRHRAGARRHRWRAPGVPVGRAFLAAAHSPGCCSVTGTW